MAYREFGGPRRDSRGPRRSFGGPRRDGGFRKFSGEKTKITCAECGKEDSVPFKPREGSKVLCGDCFRKSKGLPPRREESSEKETEETEETSEEESEESKEDSEDEEVEED